LQQTPQLELPPLIMTEKSRKNWIDKMQNIINETVKNITGLFFNKK